jgi:hypothetical protein
MEKKTLLTRIIWLALPLLILMACGSKTPSEPILTFHGNECSYSGPATIPSMFTMTWVVEESEHTASIYAIVTLDQGKSVQDLAVIPAEDPPPAWVHKVNYDLATSPGTFTKSINLSENAAFQGGPIYIVCFHTDENTAMGAVGPIEVKR